MTDENQAENSRSSDDRQEDRQPILRVFLRIYFLILFISAVIGLTFSRQIGAILVFSLVSSLLVFICCNCGQCFKTQVISGHVLVGPPGMAGLPPGLASELHNDQIAYIIVAPRVGPSTVLSEECPESPAAAAAQPLYPVYSPNPPPFQPPPSYEESQRQYK